jgi:TolA-binding protein
MQRTFTWIVTSMIVSSLTGCVWFTTKHEGKELKRSVARVEEEQELQKKALPKLQQVLDEATKLLARNSADLGNQVASLSDEMKTLNGLVQEAKRLVDEVRDASNRQDQRLTALEQRIAELEAKAVVTQKTASQLWEEGSSAMKANRYEDARTAFRNLLVKYPGDQMADDAQFQRAESYFKEKKYQESLGEYQRVFEKYSDSPLADDAAYKAGEAAEALKWCTDARAYFGLLVQKWPKSDFVAKAKAKDKTLKAAAGDKKKCQS